MLRAVTRKVAVTRHAAARKIIESMGHGDAEFMTHLSGKDIESLQPGDLVIGTLPVHLIAAVNKAGARYLNLTLDVPENQRGKNHKDMARFNPRLEPFAAIDTSGNPTAVPAASVVAKRNWSMTLEAYSLAIAMLLSGAFCTQLLGQVAYSPASNSVELVAFGLANLALFILGLNRASSLGLKFLTVRTRTLVDAVQPRRVLISGLSELDRVPATGESIARKFLQVVKDHKLTLTEVGSPADSFQKRLIELRVPDPQELNRFRWLTNLVTVNAHAVALKKVIMLPSTTTVTYVAVFQGIVRELYKNTPGLEMATPEFDVRDAIDYLKFDAVLGGLADALRAAGVPSTEVCVDVTPGTAQLGIGGAISTLDNEATFVHVALDRHIRQFDTRIAVSQGAQ